MISLIRKKSVYCLKMKNIAQVGLLWIPKNGSCDHQSFIKYSMKKNETENDKFIRMGRPLFVLELSIKHATNTETSNILDIGTSFITNIYIQSLSLIFCSA